MGGGELADDDDGVLGGGELGEAAGFAFGDDALVVGGAVGGAEAGGGLEGDGAFSLSEYDRGLSHGSVVLNEFIESELSLLLIMFHPEYLDDDHSQDQIRQDGRADLHGGLLRVINYLIHPGLLRSHTLPLPESLIDEEAGLIQILQELKRRRELGQGRLESVGLEGLSDGVEILGTLAL